MPAVCDQLVRYLVLTVEASGICFCFLQDRIPYRGTVKCHLLGQDQVSHIEARSIITDGGKDKCHILRQGLMLHIEAKS